jgi:hypothetical protein
MVNCQVAPWASLGGPMSSSRGSVLFVQPTSRPYSAPSAGPPPWDLYEFTPTTAFGVATAEPHGATRWHFDV